MQAVGCLTGTCGHQTFLSSRRPASYSSDSNPIPENSFQPRPIWLSRCVVTEPQFRLAEELFQQPLIGSGERVLFEFVGADPFERRAAERLRFMRSPLTPEESQMHRLLRIGIGYHLY